MACFAEKWASHLEGELGRFAVAFRSCRLHSSQTWTSPWEKSLWQ